MSDFSKRSQCVSPSLTLSISAKSNQMAADGVDVVSFGVGEPDFNTPQNIIDAAKVALDEGKTKYTPGAGVLQLRKEISRKFKEDNNLTYAPDQIVVSNGAKQSLFNCIQLLVDSGDEVIIPSPYWLSYPELVKLCDGKCVFVQTKPENGFKLTPAQLEEAITDRTKALMLNTPSNPTGSVYSLDELTKLAKVCVDKHVWVISDEIYEKLVYDGHKHYSIASINDEIYNLTLTVNGMSKAYAMTGWRMGYVACPNAKVAKLIDGMQGHETSCANSISQYASIEALRSPKSQIEQMRVAFDKRRLTLIECLDQLGEMEYVKPYGAFYVLMSVKFALGKSYKGEQINSANDFARLLLDDYAVALIPCEGFGADGYIRLSYAVNEQRIREGIRRMGEFISQLN